MSCSPRSYLQSWRIYRPYGDKLEYAERLPGQAANYSQQDNSLKMELESLNRRINALEKQREYLERQNLDQRTALEAKDSIHAQANAETVHYYQTEIQKL